MRPGNRVPAALVAAVLAAAGVVAVVEIIAAAVGRGPVIVDWPSWSRHLAAWTWSSGAARFSGVLIALAGLGLLLGSQLGGRSRFRARPTVAGSAVFVSQRALARALRSAALSVDGIAAVSVRVRRRRAVVRPRLRARVSYGAIPQLKAALSRSLDGFDLLRPPRIVIEPTAARRRGRRRHRAVARIPAAAGAAGPPTPAAGTPRSGAMQSGWGASAARPVAGRPVAGRAVAGRAATGQPAGGQPAGGRSAGERSASGGGRSRERIRQGNAAGQEGRR